MFPILALDTAGQTCAVALAYLNATGQVRQLEQQVKSARNFETRLVPLVREVCQEANLEAQDLAAVVVTLGPGSFTGQRLALCFASGLRVALGTKHWGFTSSLLAATTARRVLLGRGIQHGHIAVLLDSRRTEPFAQSFAFQSTDGQETSGQETSGLEETGEIVSLAPTDLAAWLQGLAGAPLFVCGDGLQDPELTALVERAVPEAEILSAIGRGNLQDLIALAQAAGAAQATGAQGSHGGDKPLKAAYVRPPDTSAPRKSALESP